jgi:hypothetical protein
VYAREIGGREFTFGVSGKSIRNILVMYDRQTDSLWSQLLGESVSDEMQGTILEFLPSWHTTWAQWKEPHPDTLALHKGFRGSRDPYASYLASSSAGLIGETIADNRLPGKEFVIGVALEDAAVAYPFRVLSAERLVNDAMGGRQLLVFFDPADATGLVYDRQIDNQNLAFTMAEDGNIIDAETGSVWDPFSGTVIEGPLAGRKLERVRSTVVFWFGWKDFY